MRVERAELRELHLSLRERFEISSGGRQDRRIVLLRLTVDGVEGWSECVAAEDPSYSYETTDTAWHVLTDFILPAVVGTEFDAPRELADVVPWVRGHRMAKAAVEMRKADPDIRLSAAALPNREWTMPLLEAAGEHLDYISIHRYWLPLWQRNDIPDYLTCIMLSEEPEKNITEAIGILELSGTIYFQ